MTTYLHIIGGPLKGFKLRAKNGLLLGGANSHVNLKDHYFSDPHARIVLENSNFYLKDENSETGTYCNGRRISRCALTEGSEIKIGRSLFQVFITQDNIEIPKNTDIWTGLLKNKYQKLSQKLTDQPISLTSLSPIIKLSFIKGLQLETTWHIGYGPRSIGAHSLDLIIMEKNAPDICFELFPSDTGVLYQTNHPKVVKINNMSLKQKTLEQNDKISILNSILQVDLIK